MIDSCAAFWYDGRTSQRREVTVSLVECSLIVSGPDLERAYPLAEVRIDQRLGRVRRTLRFPDGASAETGADDFLDELLKTQGRGGFVGRLHRWEMSLGKAGAALLLTLAVVFCLVRYGVPLLAQRVAFALPAATEEAIGRETLQILDKVALQPSALPKERRLELERLFRAMVSQHPERRGWRLEFRASREIGANAFALPSGIVILTDRMVEIAENDHQLAGVLAHETGHVTHRHALRHLLQNSATALVVAGLTGDIVSVSSFAATMPAVIINAKYSRDFEREADAAAVEYLKGRGIPVRRYAEILARLDADHYKERDAVPRLGEMLGSHPLMLERVQNVLAAE
ncbi:peptidase, M48 family [Citrifermentans bemidjiense Bem]|uniref:Peptidase, M48 family n=1 Tax=Citrifermentans bemidjiense (strain ATCC BAA-1014 / DSM 16622 / JCM 12645 / Bem) TaxID=404380 RepID=B5ECB5_CITBB|nr:M48 family metallopeptidase [Citrifermentans bemidjiense]ACH37543.1 peptidase, M48 family [Citrifermentans bemidjiense Bem]